MAQSDTRILKALRIYCRVAALAAGVLGCVVIFGSIFHIQVLMSVAPGLVTMKVNTALSLAFSATSLWLLLPAPGHSTRQTIARALAALVLLVALATLSEYIFGWNLGIDQLLIPESVLSHGTSSPGRMSPASSSAFLTIALALLLLDRKSPRGNTLAQVLSLWSALMGILAATGYAYHASILSRILLYTQVALHTAAGLLLLSTAIFVARPKDGIACDLTGEGTGSVMARQLLPAVFFVPILLGRISLQGQFEGFYGKELRLALYATSTVIVFAILVWLSARKMNGEYERRSAAEVSIRELNVGLELRVAERTESLKQQTAVLGEQAALLDLAHDAIVVCDMANRIVFWSRGAQTMYGWTAQQAVGRFIYELLLTEFEQSVEQIDAHLLREGHWDGEAIHYTRDGIRLNIATRWALKRDAQGKPSRVLGINSDITEQKRSEDALFLEKERAQVTLNSIGDAVISTNIQGRISFLNSVAEKMTGWSIQEAADRPMAEVFRIMDATSRETTPDPMDLAIVQNRTMSLPLNCLLIQRNGTEIPIEDSVSPIHNREGKPIGAVIVFRDVSEARAMTQRMTHSAQHDFLTGLPNRMLLNDRVNQAIGLAPRRGKKVAVLFLDLDGFKHINDSLGHPVGDKLLQSIAKRLVECVRGSDTVSRQGGDEFVVLLAEMAQAEDAAITARRMLQAVAQPHSIDQHDLHVSTSIGVSVYPDDGMNAETLIKNADTAMYQAKEHGRQSYQFFKPAMNVRAVERQSIEENLRRALERNEFTLNYQPKINLTSGEISGAEALLRWTHPVRGMIPPGRFIPVAEDSGLILSIGRWALGEACRQARKWMDAGLPLPGIAANISAIEFRDEEFLAGVFAILNETNLDPKLLELELTESVLMKHPESTESVLKALRAKGVRVAVDDFGTGYSSLSYLQKFPIDALKIDQSFVRRITTAPGETTIVTAIIGMGRSLNLTVVAEGVETRAEMEFLQTHQCDEAQGYYFGRPMIAQEFAALLKKGSFSRIPTQGESTSESEESTLRSPSLRLI
jgi:diguanylate cyclase (GGDEF)-like protein/PAS domain S-box-containing protein